MDLTYRPQLDAPFDRALDVALAYLDGLPETVIGVWLAGSVARGEADANSDLDLYVLVDGAHRRRLQRFFSGVPTEIFLNPPDRARRYFDEDRAAGRRPSLDMMAEGVILFDPQGECAAIQREARLVIETGPEADPVASQTRRYLVTDALDNAADVAERDSATARVLGGSALREAMVLSFLLDGRWAPRDKDLLPTLRAERHPAVTAIDEFGRTGAIAAAKAATHALIGVDGFHEWETPPEPV